MTKTVDLCIPRETVNDDVVTIVRWYQPDGAAVCPGDKILSIETSKAILDIEADSQGYLEILNPEGSQVAVGQVVAHLHAQPALTAAATETSPTPHHKATSQPAWFSESAKRLIDRHQLNPTDFADLGLVRAADIQRRLKERLQTHPIWPTDATAPTTSDTTNSMADAPASPSQKIPTTLPASSDDSTCCKGFFADARDSAGQRGHGLAWLILNYFFRNYLLGLLTRLAPRGVLIPLHRLRGVKIGKGCYVDPTAILETAYPEQITIGNDVRVTARAVIMTHIKGPHYLRQHNLVPAQLKPVVLEDHCFVGVNAVILPGVTVGRAAVVASGAVVTTSVPPLTLVAGNPATIVKRFPTPDQP